MKERYVPYKNKEDRNKYVREYQKQRRHSEEAYRIKTNAQAVKSDTSPRNRPYKLMRAAKTRSNKLGIPFDLDRQWVADRWTGKCELTGIEFDLTANERSPISPSIDKINPELGYTKSNCRFILWSLNAFKGTMDDDLMYRIATELVANKRKKSND